MKLPNNESAYVDLKKLREYCLNPEHARGRHKAPIFSETLGLTASDAEELHQALLEAACTNDAVFSGADDFGQRYTVDFAIQ
ncbi:MAG: DUF6883 domain-containing protein, partial [Nitrospirota bacterium]